MTGIYIIKNTFNEKVYIGQSVDIYCRWCTHRGLGKEDASPNRAEYNNKIHKAMRKYGRDKFYLEVLEQCDKELLNEREKYWIAFYNSFRNGYNSTEGGDFETVDNSGENNGRALLTTEDVVYIRECYNNHIPFRVVYSLYKDKITKRGLQKVWHFENWKNICPEYHTEENKYWHSHNAKANPTEVAANNKRVFSEKEILEMRRLYNDGWSLVKIWKEKYPHLARSTVRNAIVGITYKDIH